MKYKTKIKYLSRNEAMALLKEFLKSDKEFLKAVHDQYGTDFADPDLKIKVLTGGFNKETADQELNGFYFCEIPAEAKKDILKWDPDSKSKYYSNIFNFRGRCELLRNFNYYYNIDRLRKDLKLKWYILEAKTKKNHNITDIDLLYNRIDILYNYGSSIRYNFKNLDDKKDRDFSFTSLFYNTRYKNDEIIDRSGYIKLFKIEALKNKLENIKREKKKQKAIEDRSAFEKLEKNKILTDVKNKFIETMETLKNKLDIFNYKMLKEVYDDSYRVKNAYFYGKLYKKINNLKYDNIESFNNDLKLFNSITADSILEAVKMDMFYWIIWLDFRSYLEKEDRDHFKNNLIIKNDVYIYKNFIFNKNDLTVKTGGSVLCI